MNIYRFSYWRGRCGGIVMAITEQGAYDKVTQYLVGFQYVDSQDKLKEEVEKDPCKLYIWAWRDDENHDDEFPDVVVCYKNYRCG